MLFEVIVVECDQLIYKKKETWFGIGRVKGSQGKCSVQASSVVQSVYQLLKECGVLGLPLSVSLLSLFVVYGK